MFSPDNLEEKSFSFCHHDLSRSELYSDNVPLKFPPRPASRTHAFSLATLRERPTFSCQCPPNRAKICTNSFFLPPPQFHCSAPECSFLAPPLLSALDLSPFWNIDSCYDLFSFQSGEFLLSRSSPPILVEAVVRSITELLLSSYFFSEMTVFFELRFPQDRSF